MGGSNLLYPSSFHALLAQLNSQQNPRPLQESFASDEEDERQDQDGRLLRTSQNKILASLQEVHAGNEREKQEENKNGHDSDSEPKDLSTKRPKDTTTPVVDIESSNEGNNENSSKLIGFSSPTDYRRDAKSPTDNYVTPSPPQRPGSPSMNMSIQSYDRTPPHGISVVSDDRLRSASWPIYDTTKLENFNALQTFNAIESRKKLDLQTLEEYRRMLERRNFESKLTQEGFRDRRFLGRDEGEENGLNFNANVLCTSRNSKTSADIVTSVSPSSGSPLQHHVTVGTHANQEFREH